MKQVREAAMQDARTGDIGDRANASLIQDVAITTAPYVQQMKDEQEFLAQAGKDIPQRNCSSCGEPIEEKRLRALPFTRICIDCANRSDPKRLSLS